jgi:hypothetical protein
MNNGDTIPWVYMGVARGSGNANDPLPLLGKIFEIDQENPLHRKTSLKLTVDF